jgi:cytochrome P450
MTTRKVTESFIFDGHIISVGTFIDIDLLLLHMNPLFWDLPKKKLPERFLQGSESSYRVHHRNMCQK